MSSRLVSFRLRARRVSGRSPLSAGFTLIELMVAMALGLVVIGGVISVFLANQQAYRTNQALGEVQDGSRTAFELMARDIRNAGLTGCDNSSGRVANVLTNAPGGGGTQKWWGNWNNVVAGYGQGSALTDPVTAVGTAAGNQKSGTDSMVLIGAEGSGLSVKTDVEPAGLFTLNETTANLATGDVVIVCTPDHASITQISSYSAGSTITFNHAKAGTPGNCSIDLSYPTVCSSASSYVFVPNSQVTKLTAVDWFIGISPASNPVIPGQLSLYRVSLVNNTGTGNVPTPTSAEMVRGVSAMSIAYLQTGNTTFQAAKLITNWAQVNAVQVTLTLQSSDQRAGSDIKPISRTFTSTTTVRNRVN